LTDFDLATVDRLLSTTRAVRRRLDLTRPVERSVILDCIRLSQQAPTGTNRQTWRWLVLDDPAKRRALAELYCRGMPALNAMSESARDAQTKRVYDDARWFAERMADVPVHVIPCTQERLAQDSDPATTMTYYGSIFPAVWSFQLALRSRGLGSVLTTMHLLFEAESRALLELPEDVTQVALLPVGYTKGLDFKPARRPPPESITHWNEWGG
jgi:nitroreductase